MPYELEFIGINKDAKDADAICFRFYDASTKRFVVGIYDGGTLDYGEALKNHLMKYYFPEETQPTIDFVICSHSDLDHASGLSIILEEFKVNNLYMNRPWLYVDELFDKVNDGRITKQSLERRLREKYSYIENLEKIAKNKGIKIYEAFAGTTIYKKLTILSPAKEFYIDLVVDSDKTPLQGSGVTKSLFDKAADVKSERETWTKELLRDNVTTNAENEMSVVIYGYMDEESFLLTGDAGVRALNKAVEYSKYNNIKLTDVKVHQIPHHGSRHNVSPCVLNQLVGPIVGKDDSPTKTAFVSVSKGSDHPRQMVVNSYIRRGCKVFEARNNTIRHQKGMPEREGWTAANSLAFSEGVEGWDS